MLILKKPLGFALISVGVLVAIAIIISSLSFPTVQAQTVYTPPPSNRLDTVLATDWRFIRSNPPGAQNLGYDDSSWQAVTVPHTWNNQDGQDGGANYYRGIGWYRRNLTVDPAYADRQIYLQFDGGNITTTVYLNGTKVGQHIGGYSTFRFDITPYVNIGAPNVLAVQVDNSYSTNVAPISADFTFFGGLYRNVHLLTTDKLHVDTLDFGGSGVYVKQTNVSTASANLEINYKTRNL
jgi:beta-galactosidase